MGANLKPRNVGPALGRVEGYRLAHREVGRRSIAKLELPTEGWSRPAAYAAVTALIRSGTRFDALFCLNDVLAVGALRALLQHGLRVPEDVAVGGWDDVEEVAFTTPPLTSVSPDKTAIADAAVTQLLAQISGAPHLDEDVECGYELIVRASSTVERR